MTEDRLCEGKREHLEGWMRAEWMECEFPSLAAVNIYLPESDTSSILLHCFILHNLYPCTSPFPPQNGATCLMSLLCATAWILQMSCEIFLAWRDGAAVKGNRTSATEARTVIKRKKQIGCQVKMREWWWGRGWEDEGCRMKGRNMCLLCISFMCDVCVQNIAIVDSPTYSQKHSLQTLDWFSLLLWIIQKFARYIFYFIGILVDWPFNHWCLDSSCRRSVSPSNQSISFLVGMILLTQPIISFNFPRDC